MAFHCYMWIWRYGGCSCFTSERLVLPALSTGHDLTGKAAVKNTRSASRLARQSRLYPPDRVLSVLLHESPAAYRLRKLWASKILKRKFCHYLLTLFEFLHSNEYQCHILNIIKSECNFSSYACQAPKLWQTTIKVVCKSSNAKQ